MRSLQIEDRRRKWSGEAIYGAAVRPRTKLDQAIALPIDTVWRVSSKSRSSSEALPKRHEAVESEKQKWSGILINHR